MNIDSAAWQWTVIAGASELGVEVTPEQARSMSVHAGEMLQWNRISNLTAITDPMEVAIKHHVDSLALVNMIPAGARVLDAGAGGGLPGLPLKIVRPDLSLTLVDSVRKKISFLNYTIGKLNLRGIHAVHGRLEDLAANPTYRGTFDLVVCRAFSALEDFATLTLPFLVPGGRLLAMKGPQAEHDHEIDDLAEDGTINLAGTRFKIHIHRYTLPVLGDQRRLVRLTPA
jgi:16S rRNA (guanine527-N7)-methyltransferase